MCVCVCVSTLHLVFTHPMVQGVKPPPQNPTQRVWWLLGQLLTSMNKGVYLTPALYVPAAAWKSKPALPAVRGTAELTRTNTYTHTTHT